MAHVPTGEDLTSCDLLVFSSHKTATQTIARSLRANGINALHGHTLTNIGLSDGELACFMSDYRDKRDKKIKLVSVFRDPMERLVSSFFQVMSVDDYAKEKFPNFWLMSDDELSAIFSDFLVRFDGYGESIEILLKETGVPHQSLFFDQEKMFGENTLHEHYDLYLFRFDTLVRDFDLLSVATGIVDINIGSENRSKDKEYYLTYKRFKRSYKLKPDMIRNIFRMRGPLIDLFFPDQREEMLDSTLANHSI